MSEKLRKPRPPKLSLTVFRPGDLFLVKEPVLVKRVGYPMGKDDAEKHVRDTLSTEIASLFSKLGAQLDAERGHVEQTLEDVIQTGFVRFAAAKAQVSHWDEKRVVAGLASHWLKLNGFGGDLRSLHTYREESLKSDTECQVVSRRVVKTGTRYAPWSSGPDYNGEYDYEPGGLEGEQTHVLLEFRPVCALDWMVATREGEDNRLWIETKNCAKTYDSATNQRIDPVTQKIIDKDAFVWQSTAI